MQLSDRDEAVLSGQQGDAGKLAMELLVAVGDAQGAARMIDVTWAHVAGAFELERADTVILVAAHLARLLYGIDIHVTVRSR